LSLFIRVLINARAFARFFILIKYDVEPFFLISYTTFVWVGFYKLVHWCYTF
jgi:hypothetical protein